MAENTALVDRRISMQDWLRQIAAAKDEALNYLAEHIPVVEEVELDMVVPE